MNALGKIKEIIDILCQPNPKTVKSTEHGNKIFKKNKVLFVLHILGILMMISLNIISTKEFTIFNSYSFICMFEMAIFLLLCRSYPFALKIFYFALVSAIGPYSIYFFENILPLTWFSVHVFPTFILYSNGLRGYILQVALQICYLATLYKPRITQRIMYSNPVEFTDQLIKVSIGGAITTALMISITSSALKKANNEIMIHKMKQSELERQKAFLLGFSHELRNIANSLLGNIQFALMENPPEKVKSLLNSCETFGGLLLHLINNTLDVGKVEVGELEINPTSTNIYDTLEKIWSISVQLIKNRRLEGFLKIQNNMPQILKIDQYRLMQIVINLITNATKFTEKGNVSIDAKWIEGANYVTSNHFEPAPYDETDEGLFEKNESLGLLDENQMFLSINQKAIDRRKIFNNTTSTRGVLKIIVRDTGCGIDKEKLSIVFDKMNDKTSLNDSTKRLGTRLSLYVTKCLVERMNGDIRVYSQVNKGTTFILCIPLEVAEENRIKTFSKEEVKNLIESSNLRVLTVDDMHFNIMILTNYFKNLKINNTTEATNGQEAFDIFKLNVNPVTKKSFDIITMDVEMPVMDGKKAVELIRQYEHEHNLNPCLIIMVSGNCAESEISECLKAHQVTGNKKADIFLKKPVSIDELSNAITSWYQKRLMKKSL